MMDFDRFDVLTALFPFVETPRRRPRPILVVSPNDFNRSHGHVVAAMIKTGAGSRWPSDLPIEDLLSAGLQHPSVVRSKLFTLPFAVIGRKIGALPPVDLGRAATAFDRIFCSGNIVEASP